ncbi:MAG: rhodanese-like domain-containing protein [Candidatus Latescibacteria bacterium]|nr:rhodanese-like domain-containing protein [Candidatus Latescibacterota bacterium]
MTDLFANPISGRLGRTVCLLGLLVLACADSSKTAPDFADIDVAAAVALLQGDRQVMVIDIRTPGEFVRGHIAGAENIDFRAADFAQRLGSLDRERPYLMHCASGGRSTRALGQFSQLDFQRIYHLRAGFIGWEAAGMDVKR